MDGQSSERQSREGYNRNSRPRTLSVITSNLTPSGRMGHHRAHHHHHHNNMHIPGTPCTSAGMKFFNDMGDANTLSNFDGMGNLACINGTGFANNFNGNALAQAPRTNSTGNFTGSATSIFNAPFYPAAVSPDSPITPNMTMSDVAILAMELGSTRNELISAHKEIEMLKGRVKELEEGKRTDQRCHCSINGSSNGSPNSHSTTTTIPNHNPNPSRRHKRTDTPEHISHGAPPGTSIYTFGIAPQEDRALLNDFFDAIKNWANKWTVQGAIKVPNTHAGARGFLGSIVNIQTILADQTLRCALVAAMVSHDITVNALCDDFPHKAAHPDAKACLAVQSRFLSLGDGNHAAKHRLLLDQKTLFTRMKGAAKHKEWRVCAARRFTSLLVNKLAGLVTGGGGGGGGDNNDVTTRDSELHELLIRALRISFRMRMDAVKWTMDLPGPGRVFNSDDMVNESRGVCGGDVLHTMDMVTAFPDSFAVRFSVTPTIIKSEFGAGTEVRENVHKALVHIERKDVFVIGSERAHVKSSSPTK
ncbi:hypothetical protein K504DRAFT_457862 [Pleomassaria siparia CBS 279.74]|uniref:Uncharacterized protein n=1 Tax=Pleomassaria siparia CBS 279.74 TaxID=1314801 RepID=A0A6G1KSA9_9PLEO|nr:hypothetical protein K504DRAFT_457862 [Pleomassaria siparia CBS 279.74]